MSNYRWLVQLHQEHHATLLRLAQNQLRYRVGSADDAEDIVQQVFLIAITKDISGHEEPLGWLMKTTYNLCRRRGEKANREVQKQQRVIQEKLDQSAQRSIYAVEWQESDVKVQELLMTVEQTLNCDDWRLFRDLCVKGYSREDVARERGITLNALRVRIHRMMCKLRKVFVEL